MKNSIKLLSFVLSIILIISSLYGCTFSGGDYTPDTSDAPRPTPPSSALPTTEVTATPIPATATPEVTPIITRAPETTMPTETIIPTETPEITTKPTYSASPITAPTNVPTTSWPVTEESATPHPDRTPELVATTFVPEGNHVGTPLKEELCISEVSSNNVSYIINGVIEDWIELYNGGSNSVNLADYYISDDINLLTKCKLPEVTVPAGGYHVLSCTIDVSFSISSSGETLYLVNKSGEIIETLEVCALEEDYSMPVDGPVTCFFTPGYANKRENYYKAITAPKGLIINEVLAKNGGYGEMINGEYQDYIEVYNNSNSSINLSKYYLTDKKKNLTKWQMPDVTLEPYNYYVIYAVGIKSSQKNIANFSISTSGEKVYITDGTNFVDALNVPALSKNQTYGRLNDKLYLFEYPTVNIANSHILGERKASAVSTSIKTGEYSSKQVVHLYSIDGGNIYYTVNNTEPTTSSYLYDGSGIVVNESMTIRAIQVIDGFVSSNVCTFNYLINIPDFELDIVSLTLDYGDFDYIRAHYKNTLLEVKANVTYFKDGNEEFSLDCGMAISGQFTRQFDKQSFKLKFNSKYGYTKLNYKLFDNLDVDEFDGLILRSGGGAMANYKSFFNDEFCTSVVTSSDYIDEVYAQEYIPVNLFVNGEYYGIYFLKDKINESFVSYNEGTDPETDYVTIIKSFEEIECSENDDQGWYKLWNYICTHDLTVKSNYDYVASQISLESVSDFYILETWSANFDAANVRVCKSKAGDGKWRFIYYDLDYSFYVGYAPYRYGQYSTIENYNPAEVILGHRSIAKDNGIFSLNLIFYELMKNSEFQTLFFERLDYLVQNDLSTNRLLEKFDELYNSIKHDMVYNIARWKGASCGEDEITYTSVRDWFEEVNYVRTVFISDAHLENIVSGFKKMAEKLLVK